MALYILCFAAVVEILIIKLGTVVRVAITVGYFLFTLPFFGWLFREMRDLDEHSVLWKERARSASRQLYPEAKTAISGIPAGKWICIVDKYEDDRKEAGAKPGEFLASYHLVLSTVHVNGIKQSLALSNGSILDWHPAGKAFCVDQPDTHSSRSHGSDLDSTQMASHLERIISFLALENRHVPIIDLAIADTREISPEELHALVAAFWWHMIEVRRDALGRRDFFQAYQRTRNGAADFAESFNGLAVSLTPAGHAWHRALADQKTATAIQKGKQMPNRRQSFSFGSYSNVNFSYAEGNNTSKQSFSREDISPADLVAALQIVLKDNEVPWDSPALVEARQTLETVVTSGDVNTRGLKTAVSKVVQVCEALALGIAGNTAFEVLKAFAQ
ncbi:hypothetical protein [Cryptosporangium japonicum]|uniref:Uncharacterized protein n=1 Tax=Cryptosporangium japonicum TaxID=80872 RepID=A0ABN0VAX3_9ACTN